MSGVQTGEHARENCGSRGEDLGEMRWDRTRSLPGSVAGRACSEWAGFGVVERTLPTGHHWAFWGIHSRQHQTSLSTTEHHWTSLDTGSQYKDVTSAYKKFIIQSSSRHMYKTTLILQHGRCSGSVTYITLGENRTELRTSASNGI